MKLRDNFEPEFKKLFDAMGIKWKNPKLKNGKLMYELRIKIYPVKIKKPGEVKNAKKKIIIRTVKITKRARKKVTKTSKGN